MTDADELERLLVVASTDPASRPAFFTALLDATVLVLGTVDGEVVDGVAQEATPLRLVNLADHDGPMLPFFSSERMVEATLRVEAELDNRYVGLPCRDLFEVTAGSRLVLNPHGEHVKVFLPDEIESLLAGKDGSDQYVLKAAETVLVGAAADVPDRLLEVLERFLRDRPEVSEARLGWVVHTTDGFAGYLLEITVDSGLGDLHGLGHVLSPDVLDGKDIESMIVSGDDEDRMLADLAPFFVRGGVSAAVSSKHRRWPFGRS